MIPGGAFRQLRQELFFGFRAIARDNAVCAARVRRLLEQERWPADRLLAMRRALLHRTLTSAVRRIPVYRNIKLPASPQEAERRLGERFPVGSKEDLLGGPEQ